MPVLCPTALRVDRSYTRDYILIANFVAMLAVPFLLITTLNFRLFKTIKVCYKMWLLIGDIGLNFVEKDYFEFQFLLSCSSIW